MASQQYAGGGERVNDEDFRRYLEREAERELREERWRRRRWTIPNIISIIALVIAITVLVSGAGR